MLWRVRCAFRPRLRREPATRHRSLLLVEHPAIELTLELEDRFVDVLNEGYDAVIRHGPVHDTRVIVKHLAASRRVLVASPAYLRRWGSPASLEDLKQHRGIIYSFRGRSDWRFRVGRRFVTVQPRTALRLNNGLLMERRRRTARHRPAGDLLAAGAAKGTRAEGHRDRRGRRGDDLPRLPGTSQIVGKNSRADGVAP